MTHYFQFLRYCVDESLPVPASIEKMEWEELFAFCEEQAVLGVGYKGLERLAAQGLRLPKVFVFTWYASYEQIAERNRELNAKAVEICRRFEEEGFGCCLLKGQGNAAMYPDPQARTPGDVDVWIWPDRSKKEKRGKTVKAEERREIIEYVRSRHEVTGIRYHHVEYEEEDVPVEVHFTPCTMNNPLYNRRLQLWFRKEFKTERRKLADAGEVEVPTVESNTVYQLCHMMHHFFDEGLGLSR